MGTDTIGVVAPEELAGEALLENLAAASFPSQHLRLLGSEPDAAARVGYGSTRLPVEPLSRCDYTTLEHLLIPAPGADYPEAVQSALAAGCRVTAMAPGNASAEADRERLTLVPVAAQLIGQRLVAAAGAVAPVTGVDAMALDPASAGGQASVQRLARECAEVLNARSPEPPAGDVVRAFNAVPGQGAGDVHQDIPFRLTRVDVPVFFGQAGVYHIAFGHDVGPAELEQALAADAGFEVSSSAEPQGARDGIDSDTIGVTVCSRQPASVHRLWVVADNLRLEAKALMAGVTG
jgi:aspartate-semialdehyde dehydrogenase